LDKEFLNVAMNQVPANHKLSRKAPYNHPVEKFVLRKAFDCKEDPYLPDEILWYARTQLKFIQGVKRNNFLMGLDILG
jgi:asparagine synthase (glutamine-hydrolysing)